MSAQPVAPDARPLISISEAAALAGLSKSVAYRLASQNQLPGLVKLPGCRLLVRRRVLEDWLAGAELEQSDRLARTDSQEAVPRARAG